MTTGLAFRMNVQYAGLFCALTLLISCGGSTGRLGQTVAHIQDAAASNVMVPTLVWHHEAPLVLFYDDSSTSIYAAYPFDNSWQVELVDTSGGEAGIKGQYLKSAVDGNGIVHAAYRNTTSNNIRYLAGIPGAWAAIDPLPPGENRGIGLDIAVDLGNNPWIAYRNDSTQALEVVYRSGENWLVDTVDGEGNTGFWPAIDSDLGGRIHVAYQNSSEPSVRVADFQNVGQWNIRTVEAGDGAVVGRWLSIGLRAGHSQDLSLTFPRLAYVYERDAEMTLRFAAPNAEGTWDLDFVDRSLFGGSDNCLAVAGNGDVWLVYFDAVGLDLKVARRQGGKWRTGIVDSAGAVGFWSDCMIDPHGRFHVVYVARDELGASIRHQVVRDAF